MIDYTNKEAKKILKASPHKWIYNNGLNLFCKVCEKQLNFLDEEVIELPVSSLIETFDEKHIRNRLKIDEKSKRVFTIYGTVLVPKHWFKDCKYPSESKIVVCNNCLELEKVLNYSIYVPFRYKILLFFKGVAKKWKNFIHMIQQKQS